MAKKPMAGDATHPPKAAPDLVATFGFSKITTTRVLFEERPRVNVEGDQPQTGLPTTANMSIGIGIKDKLANVKFAATIEPDPRGRPYHIEVEMIGVFHTATGTAEQLDQFCKTAAPVIMFPYVRELVSRVTQDGRYGSVLLDPVNLMPLLGTEGWKVSDSMTSSEPAQPSSQSPSASKG